MRSLILLFCFCVGTLQAQQELSWKQADSLTYSYFIAGQYDKVQATGKAALQQGIDFYYLRMRLGISYYEQHHYEAALPHFEKAHTMNPADTLPNEYLYYSLVFTGRDEDAVALAAVSSIEFREKINFTTRTLKEAEIGAGAFITNNIAAHQNENLKTGGILKAEETLNGNVYSINGSLKHIYRNRLSWYNGFGFFSSNALGRIQMNNDNVSQNLTNSYFQLNSAATYYNKGGWLFGAGAGIYATKVNSLLANMDTANARFRYFVGTTAYTNFSGSFSAGKRMGNFMPSVSVHAANILNTTQVEAEGALLIYPFGNNRFYMRTVYAGIQNDGVFQPVFTQQLGGRITDKIWYDATASFGNHSQYITNYGFLTYNTADPVKMNLGADLRFCFKNIEIVPGYHFQQREGSYRQYKTPTDFTTTRFNYSTHLLTTSIKWKF